MKRAIPDQRTSSGESCSAWDGILEDAIAACEQAEILLACAGDHSNIIERQATGSFYTPKDVVEFFWNEFFGFHEIGTPERARHFIQTRTFVEPACGSGIFIVSLIQKLLKVGLGPEELEQLSVIAIDINPAAVAFTQQKIAHISQQLDVALNRIRQVNADFMEVPSDVLGHELIFVGNPPFVRKAAGAYGEANLYADFMLRMMEIDPRAGISLIVPLSIAFSRDYESLRARIRGAGYSARLANFDNIPDSLFKFGKPGNLNTNKANSQRCSILHLSHKPFTRIESSQLIRWSRKQRREVLTTSPRYRDVTACQVDNQFPRPANDQILAYLKRAAKFRTLGDLISVDGHYDLAVATVARNFIGIRESTDSGHVIRLRFQTAQHRDIALQVIASNLFLAYWLTMGDGFHVTRGLVERFPIDDALWSSCVANIQEAREVWRTRKRYLKDKLNSGKVIVAYDFGDAFSHTLAA